MVKTQEFFKFATKKQECHFKRSKYFNLDRQIAKVDENEM